MSIHHWTGIDMPTYYNGQTPEIVVVCTRCGAEFPEPGKGSPHCDPDDTRLTRYRLALLREIRDDDEPLINRDDTKSLHAIQWLIKGGYMFYIEEYNWEYGCVEDAIPRLTEMGKAAIESPTPTQDAGAER